MMPASSHALGLGLLALVIAVIAAAPAKAAVLGCGDVVTDDVTLEADVVCPAAAPAGLVIGSDDVTLRLAGHSIRSGGGGTGIVTEPGTAVRGTTVQNGAVEGFDTGISMTGSETSLLKLRVRAAVTGIHLDAAGMVGGVPTFCEPRFVAGNCVYRNVVDVSGNGAWSGIEATGARSHLWGNTVRGNAWTAIRVIGDRSRVVLNSIESYGYAGIESGSEEGVTGGDEVVLAGNEVTGAGIGGAVGIYGRFGTGARLRNNVVTKSFWGIDYAGTGGIVAGNVSNDNARDGVDVGGEGNLIKGNTALGNGWQGIAGAERNIDGGGNVAAGNQATLFGLPECVNVVCGQPG
jgi:hypothetical protein